MTNIDTLDKIFQSWATGEKLKEELRILLLSLGFVSNSEAFNDRFNRYFKGLRTNIHVLFELPYVDKVYRDSYYNYFSSKHLNYKRDCIRLLFFEKEFDVQNFSKTDIEKDFLGFVILRPTKDKFVGRSCLSPKVLLNSDFVCCLAKVKCNLNGISLSVFGFPHASQDSESLTCAETTIWNIMDYFGNRYLEYSPVLPSEITDNLSMHSAERLIPSKGLNILQISSALKSFGFGTRIYSSGSMGESEFRRTLNYYIESGIPVIALLHSEKIGHAISLIGHTLQTNQINNSTSKLLTIGSVDIYDSADLINKYIAIDDNFRAYQELEFKHPSSYYNDSNWEKTIVTGFVVPLYLKIYLEATKAHKLFLEILKGSEFGINKNLIKNKKLIFRQYLTTGKSFKKHFTTKCSKKEVCQSINQTKMPKFIWVAELACPENYSTKLISVLIVLDATGNDTFESLIGIYYPDRQYLRIPDGKIVINNISYENIELYENNLKGKWNDWEE